MCPGSVYGTDELLIYNHGQSVHLFHVKSKQQVVKLNQRVLGYDLRTNGFIFMSVGGDLTLFDAGKFQIYTNPCLNSVSSIPIAWVLVCTSNVLLLGTTLHRLMSVRDGIITSSCRIPHRSEFITKDSETSVSVFGECVRSTFSYPVLCLVESVLGDENDSSEVVKQLRVSCDSLIQKELTQINILSSSRASKTEFLVDIWNKLFDLSTDHSDSSTLDDSGSQSTSSSSPGRSPKRTRREASALYLAPQPQPYYQLPAPPMLSMKTSLFLLPQGGYRVYCRDPRLPLHKDGAPVNSQEGSGRVAFALGNYNASSQGGRLEVAPWGAAYQDTEITFVYSEELEKKVRTAFENSAQTTSDDIHVLDALAELLSLIVGIRE